MNQCSSVCSSWMLLSAKHMLPAATCNNAQHIVATKRGLTTACIAFSWGCLLLTVVNLIGFVSQKSCLKIEFSKIKFRIKENKMKSEVSITAAFT